VTLAPAVLALVTMQRLGELMLARRNTSGLLRRGGIEIASRHYPAMIACHTLWLVSLWIFGWSRSVRPIWLIVFAMLQFGRLWILATLGARWTTRIIIVPGETLVARGPYRLMKHPNYAIVVGEIAVLPLVFGLPLVALVFTLFNAAVLFVRIRAENRALRHGRLDARPA
jgi:methyltransferase